jgi:luciferase family oxidoreductase group 1
VTSRNLALSVLDLVPVRGGQTTGQALQASLALARTADRAGYRRYWVAEHHNMPAVAATNPALLISMVASATERIRVGSGGVMLPNHAPLVVAEQFALLEAAYPDRIDLGIGRAPGSDPVTSWALRHGAGGVEADAVNRFPEHVENVIAMMDPAGVGLDLGGRSYELRATPRAVSRPPVWLLGSSDYSARLAASLGLPYVFAHHFSGQGTAEALELYRREFRPSGDAAAPTTFLTVNACVADTAEEAERLARPYLLSMVALRTGGEMKPQLTVEEAEQVTLPPQHEGLYDGMRRRWVVGTPETALAELEQLAATYDVDEVMLHPVTGSSADDPVDRTPGRERTLELLAAMTAAV